VATADTIALGSRVQSLTWTFRARYSGSGTGVLAHGWKSSTTAVSRPGASAYAVGGSPTTPLTGSFASYTVTYAQCFETRDWTLDDLAGSFALLATKNAGNANGTVDISRCCVDVIVQHEDEIGIVSMRVWVRTTSALPSEAETDGYEGRYAVYAAGGIIRAAGTYYVTVRLYDIYGRLVATIGPQSPVVS
jgi:hypothetical protein